MASATLIVGLGNPGPEYAQTRHNVGYWAVDRLAQTYRMPIRKSLNHALIGGGDMRGWRVILAKPQTFMNLSGKAVKKLLADEKLGPEDLLVIHDEMDLELGRVKLKTTGGDAGHNGVGSIIQALGTREFRRLRIGVGHPPEKIDGADWVLTPFLDSELEQIEAAVVEAAERAAEIVVSR